MEAFAILGLDTSASEAEAKAAFRKLALRHHPDKSRAADAHARFQRISDAYALVVREIRRGAGATDDELFDPLADVFGEGWARKFAEGTVDPSAVFAQARADARRAGVGAAEDDDEDEDDDEAGLREAMAAVGLGGSADGDESNPFKSFFDSLPDDERPAMLALFEKTFPAFLASELEDEQQTLDEQRVLDDRVAGPAPRAPGGGESAPSLGADERAPLSADQLAAAEAHNEAAVLAFEDERYGEASAHLSRAIAIDPSNASFWGNRSLARERDADFDAALADADRSLALEPAYALGYARRGAALARLGQYAAAAAAFRRGLTVDGDCQQCADGLAETSALVARRKADIIRAGQRSVEREWKGDRERAGDGPASELGFGGLLQG
jgi:curved DNA-binding protein CbpA